MRYVTGDSAPDPTHRRDVRRSIPELVLAALVVAFLAARFRALDTININWDEFYFLSRIHELERGELRSAFQTFHVHLFRWVLHVRGTEVDQVIAARHAMFGLGMATTALAWFLGWRVSNRMAGWVAALATVTFSFVLRHGDAFRADPMVAFLFMASAAAIVWRPLHRGWLTASAITIALALTISVKTLLFAPAIGALLLATGWDEPSWGRRLRRIALYAGVLATSCVALFLVHALQLSTPELEVVRKTASSGSGMWGGAQWQVARRTFLFDWPFWALAVTGAAFAGLAVSRGARDVRRGGLVVLALLLPMASLVVYRNTFPYFYVTFVPAVAVATGFAAVALTKRAGRWADPRLALLLIAVPFALRGRESIRRLGGDGVRPQRELLDGVHAIFPEPVSYIDRAAMVASFRKVGPFMSTYVLGSYRRRATPVMHDLLAEAQPKLLIANVTGLELDQPWRAASNYRLLREDFEVLRRNFVPHWGPVWVAGKRIVLEPGGEQEVHLAIRGPYTAESDADVVVDGARVAAGAVITLEPGDHRVRATRTVGATTLTLRYGNHLPVPPQPPPTGALFRPL